MAILAVAVGALYAMEHHKVGVRIWKDYTSTMGSIEAPSDGVFGYDFEDQQTQMQLDLIDDLQKIDVSKSLDLPQLVVVGDQSTGKSSVLQAVTDIPFPINDEMCTLFATEITLQRTSAGNPTTVEISIDPSADEPPERRKELLAWQPTDFNSTTTLDKAAVSNIFKQAKKIIIGDASEKNSGVSKLNPNRLSNSTLRITRRGPKETNFTIVDVPGLVRGNETHPEYKTAKGLVKHYLDNPRSIVVVVIDVVDLERQEIFQMLNDMSDEESRVIGVINKCDTKQKQSHDWVFGLIQNKDQSESRRFLKEGWYGLRNRQASEQLITDVERDKLEDEFFKGDDWKYLPRDKLGRNNLKRALVKMRNTHIKQSFPGLLLEIETKLDRCITHIDQLGPPRTTNQAQFVLINQIAMAYSKMTEAALDGRYEIVNDEKLFARRLIRSCLQDFYDSMDKEGLKVPFRDSTEDAKLIGTIPDVEWPGVLLATPTYSWIQEAIERYRGKEDADEVNLPVKTLLWKQQMANWKHIAISALRNVQKTVDSVSSGIIKAACPDKDLGVKLQQWLQDDFAKSSRNAKDELRRLLDDEEGASLHTLNPLRQEKRQLYQQKRIWDITEAIKAHTPIYEQPHVADPPLKVNAISTSVVIRSILAHDARLVGTLNTHDSLASYYNVAMHRFVDNFATQVVERHLLGPNGPLRLFTSNYVTTHLYGEENAAALDELAGEDPGIAQKRIELCRERDGLQESWKRVQNFRVV
ncbi:hypothetical protein V495_04136 [Pseudogymnoascus sp. VKM F-4514 (FW-929)]|nr:hypothetical protein V495_04136 [Pseudogymnoascus sp. VKM F-4514 (FW-929)]KFY58672.1 hypothetical protein V497_04733 [Pseudogymnoascus sp. VKM F-4516 (FW-969)]